MESPRSRRRLTRSAMVVGSVTMVLAAVTCLEANVSLADPQVSSGGLPVWSFPTPLDVDIARLEADSKNEHHEPYKATKKYLALHRAEGNLPHGFKSDVTVKGLTNPAEYRFDSSKKSGENAPLFARNFGNHPDANLTSQPHFYSYSPNNQIWVDFANHLIGGGVFGNGMVQEEMMALSIPELANAASLKYKVRTDSAHMGAYSSDPEPLLFTDMHRTIDIPDDFYRNGWEQKKLPDYQSELDKAAAHHPPQVANILAIAVEHLSSTDHALQYSGEVINDLFDTFVAGYTLAKEKLPGTVINTGNIGTGDFNNDPKVVYVLQKLAWRHIGGLTVRYWSLESKIQQDGDTITNLIVDKWKKDGKGTIKSLLDWTSLCLNNEKACT